jgi:hypothetical protein
VVSLANVVNPTSPATRDQDWYTIEEVATILHCDPRHARRLLGTPPAGLTKPDPEQTTGRPRILYHYMAHPELKAGHRTEEAVAEQPAPETAREMKALRQSDLVVARFRLQAVQEFMARRAYTDAKTAAEETCLAWARRPRAETVTIKERLPGGHSRSVESKVELGDFSVRTLQGWHSIYKRNEKLPLDAIMVALAPRYSESGREKTKIPPALLYRVHALSVSTARADVAKAVELVRRDWPGDWPEVSLDTIRRRLRQRDAAGVMKTLGKKGIGEFRLKHSPDITRDYSQLPFNGLWQLDDLTEDIYGHSQFDWMRLVRPFVYAIIRVPTRQWICAVACEARITQDQVRRLMGYAMASRMGGIPDCVQFERGAVACDEYMEALLRDLGVKVMRTSMDGGQTYAGSLPYTGKGHFQGKGVIERNIRQHHDLNWDARGQVGGEERHTAHENMETWKREALRRIAAGERPIAYGPDEIQARIFAAFEDHNNRPHGALPETYDNDGHDNLVKRHMTPNEYAATVKGADAIRVMDERLIPLFDRKGTLCIVAKNGIRFNNFSYGRFHEALAAMQGQQVTVRGIAEYPDYCYIDELAALVERWDDVPFGQEGQTIGRKRAIEKRFRNEFDSLMAKAAESDGPVTVNTVRFTTNPTQQRRFEPCAPDALLQRALSVRESVEQHKRILADQDRKFDLPAAAGEAAEDAPKGPSLMDEIMANIKGEVEAMSL